MMTIRVLVLVLVAGVASAQELRVPVTTARVIDADTVEVEAAVWPGMTAHTRIRLRGIDTPESYRPDCDAERELAAMATAFTRWIVEGARTLTVVDPEYGTYAGRLVADLDVDGSSLSQMLLDGGHARPYTGRGARPEWCE